MARDRDELRELPGTLEPLAEGASGERVGFEQTLVDPESGAQPRRDAGPVDDAQASLVGRVLGRRFEVLSQLGAGGMGTVYRARDRELDEVVALKVLNPEVARSEAWIARFRREVKLARRVTHPNVARTYELGEHEGIRFLTMELVSGESLAGLLARHGRLDLSRALPILTCACDALAAAHAAGVVHRDIKPDNVLVARDGRIVVTDFGIAASADEPGAATRSGLIVGTPGYMAPEQVEGGEVGPAADLYALGVLAFELVTGQLPFEGSTAMALATARLLREPPDPCAIAPSLSRAAGQVILRALSRRPEGRFASALELKAALVAAEHGGVPASPIAEPLPVARAHTAPMRVNTVAVLPLVAREVDAWLAEGLAEEINDALAGARGFRVLSRAAVLRAGDPQRLGANLTVEGTLRPEADRIRASLRLVDLESGVQLWSARHTLRCDALLTIADDAARGIARTLGGESAAARDAPADAEALELYVRARQLYARFSREAITEAIAMLREAQRRAPGHPVIESGLALALTRASFFDSHDSKALLADAHAAAERALERAPHLGEPHLAAGQLALNKGDAVLAARAFRAAIARTPSLAEAHMRLGFLVLEAGDFQEGARRVEVALALDSTLGASRWELARICAFDGDWPAFHRVLEKISGSGPRVRWLGHLRYAAWEGNREKLLVLEQEAAVTPPSQLFDVAMLGGLLDVFLRREPHRLRETCRGLGSASAGDNRLRAIFTLQLVAESEAYLGDRERALDALERAARTGLADVAWFDRCPLLAPLREDPRFAAARVPVAARAEGIIDAMWG
jgi:eukaryotic-like serine/threonine-protein kinase